MNPRSLLTYALKSGKVRRLPCAVCGNEKSQAHHSDYSRPLDVTWLCSRHHAAEHKRLRDLGIKIPGERGSESLKLKMPAEMLSTISELAMGEGRGVANMIRRLLTEAIERRDGR